TKQRWDEWKEEWEKQERSRPKDGRGAAPAARRHFGTVGAVALDRQGNLAAGTSTGGMNYKWAGRGGDSPIIGAGTYADNGACAVSCTGHGEFFIRYAVAHDIAALVKYKGVSVPQAADEVVQRKLKKAGAEGGVIALDARGNFAATFNSEQMTRGYVTSDGTVRVAVLEEKLP